MAAEAEMKERIASLEADLAEKTRLLDEISLQVDNKDRLLSDAYESVSQLRKQVPLCFSLNDVGSIFVDPIFKKCTSGDAAVGIEWIFGHN